MGKSTDAVRGDEVDTQNITLVLPKDLLRKAKRLALERNTSVSGLLVQALADVVVREDRYEIARQHHLEWLETGADLDTNGTIDWPRDSLHS